MPWRHSDDKKLVQFFVGLRVPFHVTQACHKRAERTGRPMPSASAYYRDVIAEALAQDLGLNADEVRSWMPPDWHNNPGAVRLVNKVD